MANNNGPWGQVICDWDKRECNLGRWNYRWPIINDAVIDFPVSYYEGIMHYFQAKYHQKDCVTHCGSQLKVAVF